MNDRAFKLSRRSVIRSAAAMTGLLCPNTIRTRAASIPEAYKFAVKYSMIQPGRTAMEKLRIVKAAGFDGVEVSMKDAQQIWTIIDASKKTGVQVHGVIDGISESHSAAIELCKKVGGSSVLVIAKEKQGISYRENFGVAVRQLRRAAVQAHRNGVLLLVENVRASFLKEAEEMARFIDEVESPAVGAYFDTGNAITWTKQSAEHWAATLGHRIKKIDVKDRGHAVFGDNRLRRPSSSGTDGGEVHWENVRAELAQTSFSGWATAEVSGGDQRRLQGISTWMRQLLTPVEE